MQYNTVSGLGGGAVNALFLSSLSKGHEIEAISNMEDFWISASQSKLYQNWWGGIAAGIVAKEGIYDSSPLKDFIQNKFDGVEEIKRKFNMGIVDLVKGSYMNFNEANITDNGNMVHALYASFSKPGYFPPVEAFGSRWFSGDAIYDLDLYSIINDCIETHDEGDIVIDVLLTSSAKLREVDAHNFTSLQMLRRYMEITSYYYAMDGLLRAKFAFPRV